MFKILYQTLIGSIIFCMAINVTLADVTHNSPPDIKIGMSTALSGPAQALGQEMKKGLECYFDKINAQGGINGRKIRFIVMDDKYEPSLAASNMHQLLEKDDVLAVIGNVGTPTAVVSVPIANTDKTLLFAPYTGAGLLRKVPPDRYVINFRASYAEETDSMIKGLLSIGIKPEDIAFFIQNDAYGESGYQGAMQALKAEGYQKPESLAVGSYERNTLNVEEGLSQLINAKHAFKAIIIVGTYAPSAKFIKLAAKYFPDAYFLNVSFVGSEALAQALQDVGNNKVIVTQVVPYLKSNLPAVNEYRQCLKQNNATAVPSFVSLEGYLAAKLFVTGLIEAAKNNNLSREGMIDTFETMRNVDIGIGEPVSFDKTNHQALHSIWPTILQNGEFIQFQWQQLKKPIKK